MAARPYEDLIEQAGRTGRVLHREDIYGSGPPVNLVSEEILAFVVANVGESVIDIGCGTGPYVARLNALGRQVVGVEVADECVRGAKDLGRDVRKMSAYKLEFEDNSFESAILVETLEHLPDYEAALAEATRVARSTIVVTVPDISAIPIMSALHVVPWHLLEATHVNFFSPDILRQTLLQYCTSCETTRLGHFFDVGDEPVHMHAAAVGRLTTPRGDRRP